MSEREYLGLTYRMLVQMLNVSRKREAVREQMWDYRFGTIAAAAYNPHLKKGAAPLGPWTFFPSVPEPEQTPEDHINALSQLAVMMPPTTDDT